MPPKLSEGEEAFAMHCDCYKLSYVREFLFNPERKWRIDFAFLEARLLVEIEGGTWTQGRHSRGDGFSKDLEKYNAAVLAGYRILRFTSAMVASGLAIDTVREALNGNPTHG